MHETEKDKASGRTIALLRCVIVAGVVMFGTAPAFVQSPSTSSASPSPATEAAGKLAIAPQFDDAWPFSEGLARVKQNGKWGFIDRTGALAIAASFDEAESFSDERAEFKQNGKWGFIDKAGKVVIAPEYQAVRSFTEGLAAVKLQGKWGFIDKAGKIVISPAFLSARSFTEGYAAVVVPWGLGAFQMRYIDKTGTIVIKSVGDKYFDYATEFSEGLAIVCHRGFCRYIDKTGKIVIAGPFPVDWARVHGFSEGLAGYLAVTRVILGKIRYGFLDMNGNLVIPLSFGQYAVPEVDDVVGGVRVSDIRVLDKTDAAIELPSLTRKYVFSEGLAAVEQGDKKRLKWGFIDHKGTMVIPATFDRAYRFSGGLALVFDSGGFQPLGLTHRHGPIGRYGYIDKTGTMVIGPYVLDSDVGPYKLKDFSEGLAPVVINGKWGYASRDR